MEKNKYRPDKVRQHDMINNQPIENRKIVVGGLALILLAALALVVRIFFADLNPYVLAGAGAVAYVVYLGVAMRAKMERMEEENQRNELVKVEVRVEQSMEERS